MHNILLTPGDGIGPEVMDATQRVLGWYGQNRNFGYTVEEGLIGGTAEGANGGTTTGKGGPAGNTVRNQSDIKTCGSIELSSIGCSANCCSTVK